MDREGYSMFQHSAIWKALFWKTKQQNKPTKTEQNKTTHHHHSHHRLWELKSRFFSPFFVFSIWSLASSSSIPALSAFWATKSKSHLQGEEQNPSAHEEGKNEKYEVSETRTGAYRKRIRPVWTRSLGGIQLLQEQTGLSADPGISWLSSSLTMGLSQSSPVFKTKGFAFYTHSEFVLIHPLMINIKYIHWDSTSMRGKYPLSNQVLDLPNFQFFSLRVLNSVT